jgi:hypothetical protein
MHYHYYPLDYKPDHAKQSEQYLQYAEVYKDTIQLLLKGYLERPPIHDYSLAPILALLRQYIELQLKGIIMYPEETHEPIVSHDIISLYEKAHKKIQEKYNLKELGEPNDDVVKFLRSLGEFDPRAQAFRYPTRRDGTDFFSESEEMDAWLRERIISLPLLNDVAEKIIGDLEGIEGYLDLKKWNEYEEHANAEYF